METAALVLVKEFGKGLGWAQSLAEGAAIIPLKQT